MVVSAGWWVAVVALVPAGSRPYIGGSQHDSVLELALGYNGFGRLTGDETGSVGGGRGWGQSGWTRLFDAENGGQIAWLLPAALLLLAAGLWATRSRPRTDRVRAALVLWGGWLLVTGLVFSFMQGIFHAYYNVALAPAVAALAGTGAAVLWSRRHHLWAAAALAGAVAVTAVWSYELLGRSPDFLPWLRTLVLAAGLAGAGLLLLVSRLPDSAARAVAVAGVAVALAGPLAYAIDTAATPHTGAIPSAGPAVTGAGFRGGPPGGGPAFAAGIPPGGAQPGAGPPGGGGGRGPGGGRGMGGLLDATTPGAALTTLLGTDAGSYTWVAAVVGSNNAAGYQLATRAPVMAVGGFNGSDPSPTLAQFQQYVRDGRIHYFIGGTGLRSSSGSSEPQQIAAWVARNFSATTVDGATVYDLTRPLS